MTRDQLAMWLVENGMAEDGCWSSDAEHKADLLLKAFVITERRLALDDSD